LSAGHDPAPTHAPVVTTNDGEGEGQPESVMTVVEHLTELRRRVVISVVAIVAASILGFLVAPRVIEILKAPVAGPLVFTSPGAAFFLEMKLALMIGIALASPLILYELWAFVSPGLTRRERTSLRPWIPLAVVFLVLGILVAYLILPYTVGFLLSFAIPGVLEPLITAESYFGFVTTMFLAFGLVMQFPIVLVLLSKVGIVSVERLRRGRRYVFVGIFILAVVVTPGGDPISPIIMALVMYPLYELTIYLVGRSSRPQLVEKVEPV
jgi:sec-independent protein translocase protein TatC